MKGIFLVLISTACYYVPVYFAGLKDFDIKTVPTEFYNYYCWTTSGFLLLTAIYAICLFIAINPKLLTLKLISCWLAIAETYTLINHVLDKFMNYQAYNGSEILVTLVVFVFFCAFFIRRAIYKQKSDVFIPKNTYVVSKLPTDTLSILNYIFNHSGHKSIYQDGDLYKFSKENKEVIKEVATSEFLHRKSIVFKEIHRISNPEKVLGKKFNIRKYNCNHMVKDARGTS
jgi:hypothetical protein